MKSHAIANRLLELPDQLVFIHPSDPDKAHRVSHITPTINGIVLTSEPTGREGGEL